MFPLSCGTYSVRPGPVSKIIPLVLASDSLAREEFNMNFI